MTFRSVARFRRQRAGRRGFAAVLTLVGASLAVSLAGTAVAQDADVPPSVSVVTEVPDACELLVPADVSELLDEEVGEGRRHDVAGFPCVYRTTSGHLLALVAHLGQGAGLQGTQPGIELEYCEAEVVREIDDLGVDAALYRSARDDCPETTLWVATDVRFRGKLNPDLLRETEGRFHFVLFLEPSRNEDERVAILGEAAARALARLRDMAR